MVDISTVWLVSVPKGPALVTSRGEISEDVSFGLGTLLVVEQSYSENRPRGVWYTPSCTVRDTQSPTRRNTLHIMTWEKCAYINIQKAHSEKRKKDREGNVRTRSPKDRRKKKFGWWMDGRASLAYFWPSSNRHTTSTEPWKAITGTRMDTHEHRALKTNANVSTHMYQVINSTWYQAIYAELTGSLKGTKAAKTQPVYDIFVLLIPLWLLINLILPHIQRGNKGQRSNDHSIAHKKQPINTPIRGEGRGVPGATDYGTRAGSIMTYSWTTIAPLSLVREVITHELQNNHSTPLFLSIEGSRRLTRLTNYGGAW